MSSVESALGGGAGIVEIRKRLLELEAHEDPRVKRAATHWLAAFGGVIAILKGEGDREMLLLKVSDLAAVASDAWLDYASSALKAMDNKPKIPHLGAAKYEASAAAELIKLFDAMRAVLAGKLEPAVLEPLAQAIRAQKR